MPRGIFVTATGTDVGKTYISGELLKRIRNLGVNAGYFKAALSGAELSENNGSLIAGDAHYVYEASGLQGNPNDSIPYIFEVPASPHLAAQINNIQISMKTIMDHYENHSKNYDFILSEGSGGIICPIFLDEEKIMLTDVIKALNVDIVIVADAGLGTINSTMLTLEYAIAKGIGIRGIILNRFDKENFIHRDNLRVVNELMGLKVYTCIDNGELSISNEELVELIDF